jgi:hypothetical protein
MATYPADFIGVRAHNKGIELTFSEPVTFSITLSEVDAHKFADSLLGHLAQKKQAK